MAQARQLGHRIVSDMNLKYVTNDNPTSTDLMWTSGENILTSLKGYTERRPGFNAPLEEEPTTFAGTIRRIFCWRRWDDKSSGITRGAFIVMACEVTDDSSNVYKYQVGKDKSFQLIFSSDIPQPFDFVVANNQVYFGNGADNRRYDATDVWRWGIFAPLTAPTVVIEGSASSDPTIITHRPTQYQNKDYWDKPEVAFDGNGDTGCFGAIYGSLTHRERITYVQWFGFSAVNSSNATALTLKATSEFRTTSPGFCTGTLEYSTDSGATWTAFWQGSNPTAKDTYTATLSPDTKLQNLAVRSTMVGNGTLGPFQLARADFGIFEIWVEETTPANLLSLNAVAGYRWCYTYGNSVTGHESSPSPTTASTGLINAEHAVLSLVASDDPQVNQIRVYRSPDGGADDPALMQEITGSPFPNQTATVIDSTADIELSTRTAPARYRNDPPPPFRGMVYTPSKRIFGFGSNTVYYSGQEEISNGVPEESFPGGLDGNYVPYSSEVTGLATCDVGGTSAVVVYQPGSMEYIQGDSLDTFRFGNAMQARGTRANASIVTIGNSTGWLDTAEQVWLTELLEISTMVRPDLAGINARNPQIAIHSSGNFHHLYVLDADNGKILPYDFDLNQWMPPWKVGESCTAICSGEIAAGQRELLIARNGNKILKMTPSDYRDDGNTFVPYAVTNLFSIVEESNASEVGVVDHVSIEHDDAKVTVSISTDELPGEGAYTVAPVNQDAPNRTQGTILKDSWFNFNYPSTRKASFKFVWPSENRNFALYTLAVACKQI